ncbi:reticulon-like protein B12 [Impatiens glandulifera]|uniref:reticulon-like protein B12 n=1 Tax=Impatiens glandulifera TaxID=253017 RepID=UPI001FB0B5AB|nr:reticulon-like protein B12 [Impatiens glandulifera]
MGSSDRLFNRQRTIHQILGGGIVADVILWRRKDLTMGIMIVTVASWLMFEKSGYTLLSFVSSVLLLLSSILFFWAKSAAILNRPAPPLPDLHLSKETMNEIASLVLDNINALLSISHDIALGKDTEMFLRVSGWLGLIYIIGGLTDFITLAYSSLVVLLTLPALYEKFADCIDGFILTVYRRSRQFYVWFNVEYIARVRTMILEKQKLS